MKNMKNSIYIDMLKKHSFFTNLFMQVFVY